MDKFTMKTRDLNDIEKMLNQALVNVRAIENIAKKNNLYYLSGRIVGIKNELINIIAERE